VKDGRVVKGTSFVSLRDAGDPVELASFYYREGADELVFLDIMATPEERNTMVDIVEHISENIYAAYCWWWTTQLRGYETNVDGWSR
jgi:cyclase